MMSFNDILNSVNIYKYFTDPLINNIDTLNTVDIINNTNNKNNKCNDCESDKIVKDLTNGIIVCSNCGNVIDNIIDNKLDWVQYETNEDSYVTGDKLVTHSYPTNSVQRLQMWNSVPYRDRSLNIDYKLITEICLKLNIGKNIQDDAKIIFKYIRDMKHKDKFMITRGKNRRAIIMACVSYACNKNNCTLSNREISTILALKNSEISKGFKKFNKLIKLGDFDTKISKTEHYITRCCNNSKPRINKKYVDEAILVGKNIEKLNILSKHVPNSIASVCMVLVFEKNYIKTISKKNIGKKFNVSEMTVNKLYNKIFKYKKILFDDKLVNTIVEQMNMFHNKINVSEQLIEKMKNVGLIVDNINHTITEDKEIMFNNLIKNIKNCDIYGFEEIKRYNAKIDILLKN